MPQNAASVPRERLTRGVAIAGVAAALLWPAVWNGFPLMFPDALGYLRQSRGILLKLSGHDVPYWTYEIMRSEIYAATTSFLHHGANLWPIVFLQSVLTAWVLWLVVRSLHLPRPVTAYLAISAVLAGLTGIAWYVSVPMPDILGPLLYLSFFLLVIVPHAQRPWETCTLAILALWCSTAHATHLLLAAALCVVFAALWALKWPGMAHRGRRLSLLAGLLALAVLAQFAVHRRLYHEASLFGRPPAFLMARLIGDGPARTYLQQHCAALPWLICKHADNLPTNEEQFLWEPDGIEATATPAERKELAREEMPLLLATMRAYPVQQTALSLRNFGVMLITMGPWDYWVYPALTPAYLDFSVPGLSTRYPPTRQFRGQLPQRICRAMEGPVIVAALLLVVLLFGRTWRSRNYPVLALTAIVLVILPANAFLSGVISTIDPRLQDRVTWMTVLLAGVMLYTWWAARQQTSPKPSLSD